MKKSKSREIAQFYDRLDLIYRSLWGDALHHGLWRKTGIRCEEALCEMDCHLANLAGLANLEKNACVLDVGCGYGESAQFWASHFDLKVDGVTISEKQAERAREKWVNQVFCGDWHEWKSFGGSYERAFCVESFSHSDDAKIFLGNLRKILKTKGRVVIADWECAENVSRAETFFLKILAEAGGLILRSQEDAWQELAKAGFRPLVHEEKGREVAPTWLYIMAAFFPALRKRGFARALLGAFWQRPLLFATPFLAWFLYQSGAMRYGIWLAEKE